MRCQDLLVHGPLGDVVLVQVGAVGGARVAAVAVDVQVLRDSRSRLSTSAWMAANSCKLSPAPSAASRTRPCGWCCGCGRNSTTEDVEKVVGVVVGVIVVELRDVDEAGSPSYRRAPCARVERGGGLPHNARTSPQRGGADRVAPTQSSPMVRPRRHLLQHARGGPSNQRPSNANNLPRTSCITIEARQLLFTAFSAIATAFLPEVVKLRCGASTKQGRLQKSDSPRIAYTNTMCYAQTGPGDDTRRTQDSTLRTKVLCKATPRASARALQF